MKPTRSLSPGLVGALTAVLAILSVVVIFTGVFRKPFAASTRTVTANFERAPQLRTGGQVRLEGNVEGKVERVASGPDADHVRVTMEVEDGAGPIYANARARLGFKTLLGGAFYVDLDRGTPSAGPLGDSLIPLRNTTVQNELEDVTDVFRDGAVPGFKTLPGELATGLSDEGALSSALGTLGDVAPDARKGLTALRGYQPGRDLPELVDAVGRTVKALDTDNDEIRTLVSGAAETFRVTGHRGAEIRSTIASLPSVTFDLTTTFARLDKTLGTARGLVRRLDPAAPQVEPTLSEFRPTLVSTGTLLRSAKPLTRTLPSAVENLNGASRQLVPLIDDLKPSLARLDTTILPYLGRKDPSTGKSTTVMIGGFAAGFGGSAAQQDANGHFVRFPASASADSVYLPCKSSLINPDAKAPLSCDELDTAIRQYLSYLPPIGPTPKEGTG